MVDEEHVEVHHATGAAVQCIGVLPASVHADNGVARHGFLIHGQSLVVVCGVVANRNINGFVENQAVSIRSKAAASGFVHAIHMIGIAPAAVRGLKILSHLFVVLVAGIVLRHAGNQDFVGSEVLAPAVHMGDVVALRVDGDMIRVDA